GKRGPRSVLKLRYVPTEVGADPPFLVGVDGEPVPVDPGPDAEPLEAEQRAPQIFRAHRVDGDLAVGDRCEADEAADLDVIGADGIGGPAEWPPAFYRVDVGADPVDLGAHGRERAGEVLHVRLACGVPEHRAPLGRD